MAEQYILDVVKVKALLNEALPCGRGTVSPLGFFFFAQSAAYENMGLLLW
jgi:hypothetical protein